MHNCQHINKINNSQGNISPLDPSTLMIAEHNYYKRAKAKGKDFKTTFIKMMEFPEEKINERNQGKHKDRKKMNKTVHGLKMEIESNEL